MNTRRIMLAITVGEPSIRTLGIGDVRDIIVAALRDMETRGVFRVQVAEGFTERVLPGGSLSLEIVALTAGDATDDADGVAVLNRDNRDGGLGRAIVAGIVAHPRYRATEPYRVNVAVDTGRDAARARAAAKRITT